MVILTATDALTVNVENRQFDIINFNTDNRYPNYTTTISESSPNLKRVQEVFVDFVFGQGITSENAFWKRKINPYGLRVDQLLRRIITEWSKHNGFAVQVVYNAAFEKVGFLPLPFETIRLTKPDDEGIIKKVKYLSDWTASRIDKNKIVTFDVYNPEPEIIMQQVENAGGWDKWHGQIFYYGDNGEVKYPHNYFHAALEDAITDIKSKNARNANVSTNFMGSHILQLPFLFKDVAAETGQTEETVKESIKASFATFQGAENAAKLLMLENNIKDADGKMVPIEIKKIDLQNYDGIFEKTENTVKDTLRGQYRCPAILLDPVSTGFSVDIMDAAYNYYNNLTGHDRQIFEEVMMELFTNFVNPQILPESYAIIPLKYLSNDTTSNI